MIAPSTPRSARTLDQQFSTPGLRQYNDDPSASPRSMEDVELDPESGAPLPGAELPIAPELLSMAGAIAVAYDLPGQVYDVVTEVFNEVYEKSAYIYDVISGLDEGWVEPADTGPGVGVGAAGGGGAAGAAAAGGAPRGALGEPERTTSPAYVDHLASGASSSPSLQDPAAAAIQQAQRRAVAERLDELKDELQRTGATRAGAGVGAAAGMGHGGGRDAQLTSAELLQARPAAPLGAMSTAPSTAGVDLSVDHEGYRNEEVVI